MFLRYFDILFLGSPKPSPYFHYMLPLSTSYSSPFSGVMSSICYIKFKVVLDVKAAFTESHQMCHLERARKEFLTPHPPDDTGIVLQQPLSVYGCCCKVSRKRTTSNALKINTG